MALRLIYQMFAALLGGLIIDYAPAA